MGGDRYWIEDDTSEKRSCYSRHNRDEEHRRRDDYDYDRRRRSPGASRGDNGSRRDDATRERRRSGSRSPDRGSRRRPSRSPERSRRRRDVRSPERGWGSRSADPSRGGGGRDARSPDRGGRRSRSRSPEHRRRGNHVASNGRSPRAERRERDGSRSPNGRELPPPRPDGSQAGQGSDSQQGKSEEELRAARLAAWRAKSAAAGGAAAAPKAVVPAQSNPSKLSGVFGDDGGPTGLAPAMQWRTDEDLEAEIWRKRRESALREAEEARAAAAAEADPLDAFMNAEVLPEVQAKEAEERKKKEAERLAMLERLKAGKEPAPVVEAEEEDEDANPDLEFTVPKHKVKLIIGPGGERIKLIQRKTKTRIQVKKDAAELQRGFGQGTNFHLPTKVAMASSKAKGEEPELATIMIFGEERRVQQAKEMLMEAIDNKEQKQKQRQKEYDKKREEKARIRSIYYLRHAHDYEVLGVPVGTPKSELKAVYRKLAIKWHPDKHQNNKEEAQAKFQAIQKAYESLMTTDEDTRVEAIKG